MTIDLPSSQLVWLGTTFSQGSCNHNGQTLTCNAGDLAVGASITVAVTANSRPCSAAH